MHRHPYPLPQNPCRAERKALRRIWWTDRAKGRDTSNPRRLEYEWAAIHSLAELRAWERCAATT